MSNTIETDVLIVGAGPVGMFAVFQLGLMDLQCHLIDIQGRLGGQCAELYPEKPIYDIPAHPSILAGDLIDKLADQIRPFAPVFHLNQLVTSVARRDDGGFDVATDHGQAFRVKAVVIAAGGGAFQPRRAPIRGVEAFEGTSVFYAVRHRSDFAGQDVVVVGGGDSALDWCLSLGEIARSMTLVHRRDEFRAAPHSVSEMRRRVASGSIKLVLGQVAALQGEDGVLTGLTVKGPGGAETHVAATRMLPFFGLAAELGPIATWGLGLQENLISVDTERFETSMPGLFAIGDICHYPGKLKLILSGFHEAALMAQAVKKMTAPHEKLLFQHSTGSSLLQNRLKSVSPAD